MDDIRAGNTTIMSHKVDFNKARGLFIPIGEGSDGDLVLEQGAWLGGGAPLELRLLAHRGKQAVKRGRTDRKKLLTGRVIDTDLFETFQDRERASDEGSQTFATETSGEYPEPREVRQETPVVVSWTTNNTTLVSLANDVNGANTTKRENLLPSPVAEDEGCIGTAIRRETNKLFQQCTPLLLPCCLIA